MPATYDALRITETTGAVEFALKVVPGASRARVVGLFGMALKLAVAAPPEGGKANSAVIELLAAALRVPARHIRIVGGHTQPHKRVAIDGLRAAEVRARLAE